MHDRDCLHRFVFEHYPIRGHLVHLDAAWRALIEHRAYPEAIRGLLGEAVAASLLLAATIKFDGVLSLQLQGDGPVHLLLAQCTSGLGVRGLARHRELPGQSTANDIGALIGSGNLTVTLETDEGAQRYQGIVPIEGARLADSLQLYFQNSEQLPTRLWLHADESGACGMLLQRLPSGERGSGAGTATSASRGRDRRCLAAGAADRRYAHARGALHARGCGNPASAVQRGRHPPVRAVACVFPMPLLAGARGRHAAGAR